MHILFGVSPHSSQKLLQQLPVFGNVGLIGALLNVLTALLTHNQHNQCSEPHQTLPVIAYHALATFLSVQQTSNPAIKPCQLVTVLDCGLSQSQPATFHRVTLIQPHYQRMWQ
jgi:hypothetical protein